MIATNPYKHVYYVNLRNGMDIKRERQPLSSGSKNADEFVVYLQECGKSVDLSGAAVTGVVIRPDGETVPLTGAVSDGAACITLDEYCYAVPGEIKLTVRVSAGDVVQSVLCVMMDVQTSETSTVVDNGVIGTLSELLAEIGNMREATTAANQAAEAADAAREGIQGDLNALDEGIGVSLLATLDSATEYTYTGMRLRRSANTAFELRSYAFPSFNGSMTVTVSGGVYKAAYYDVDANKAIGVWITDSKALTVTAAQRIGLWIRRVDGADIADDEFDVIKESIAVTFMVDSLKADAAAYTDEKAAEVSATAAAYTDKKTGEVTQELTGELDSLSGALTVNSLATMEAATAYTYTGMRLRRSANTAIELRSYAFPSFNGSMTVTVSGGVYKAAYYDVDANKAIGVWITDSKALTVTAAQRIGLWIRRVDGADIADDEFDTAKESIAVVFTVDSIPEKLSAESTAYTDSKVGRLEAVDALLLAANEPESVDVVFPNQYITFARQTTTRLEATGFPVLPGTFTVSNSNSDVYQFAIRFDGGGRTWRDAEDSVSLAGISVLSLWVQRIDKATISDAEFATIQSGLTFTYTVGGTKTVVEDGGDSGEAVKECIYVSPTGSDENDGTFDMPYATVSKAIADGCRNILLYGGVYEQTITLPESGVVRIAAAEKTSVPVFIDPNRLQITDSTVYADGVYMADASFSVLNDTPMIFQDGVADETTLITDAERMPQQRGKVYRCDDTPLRKCTATELAAAVTEMQDSDGYMFFYDATNGKLYFTAPDADFAAHPIVCSSNGVLFKGISRAITLHVAGIECKYMRFDISQTVNSVIADCKASCAYASALGQFMYDDAINPRFINCEACLSHGKNNGDGFNSHCSNSGDPYAHQSGAVLENCWSHDNMDDGWSDHHRSETMIFGGLYEYNGKGGVTPSYGTHLTCRDVYSRHNYNGFYYVADGSVDGGMYGQMICYNCVAEENTRGTGQRHAGFALSGENNRMILVNCKTINNALGYVCAVDSNMARLIDCGSIGETLARSENGTFEIINTDRLEA